MTNERLQKHHDALGERWGGIKNVESFRRVARRFEKELSRYAMTICNDSKWYERAEKQFDARKEDCLRCLSKYVGNPQQMRKDVWFNKDPRGYCIKASWEGARGTWAWTDWGGDVIVAPDKEDR